MKCRLCGCTDDHACAEGCSWVEDNLCSVCVDVVKALTVWWRRANRPSGAAVQRELQTISKAYAGAAIAVARGEDSRTGDWESTR